MVFENVGEKQPSRFLSCGFILCGNEVRHFAKSIPHHHDGIKPL
jgi:hypothetical protein